MEFAKLTRAEYETFIAHRRHFIPQLPAYAAAKNAVGAQAEFVGVKADGEVVGAGVLTYQPWKKLFRKAHLTYGPTLDWNDDASVQAFFDGLRAHLKAQRNVLTLDVNPIVAKNRYEDIELVHAELAEGAHADSLLRQYGFTHVDAEFYERSDVQIRYIYTKTIARMNFDEAIGSISKTLRRRFRNTERYGVEVKFEGPEAWETFTGLFSAAQDRHEMADLSHNQIALFSELMKDVGPENGFLCIAYMHPARYLDELAEDRAATEERIATLEARKPTAKRDTELAQQRKALEQNDAQRAEAQATLDQYGDKIAINGALAFRCGNELVGLLGGMDKRFVQFARNYPVEGSLFRWAVEHELDTYNTFGVSGNFGPDAPDASVLKFKRLLNGQVEEFIGTYQLVVSPFLAKLTKAAE
ncbi:peptidoglycan pentaglycine glycine transferase (the second and third glycine)/peptidoglycan pentaglycine glycine transferase (the fourth and fifth glycine) [Arcanobacterium wilhelmae]|uniref:Peptidoglycan pentaglycine glycine transferase (The second and third glycine)/peptidoglycan pentaglycine glycine transferase (The fourth and fifth glycine) n=1 Tax=Arcanobacterium wilhelmae TaxID=1803177 RepID=A0ABT9NDH3_9ACTO|nr:peptidoglycan bridge formation glycyltransferase FemA/FemB family protein [Arcanobacterium wilhelmae]MDP9801570.1 peptidoglycan pentaglycine glycine transferase (the second and third glycine)/peptidoglycan pentaglycine glycine transferase (the fourth and fifth glycine) [Arcanobacterium wilhelmae]WFN90897.1 peptidoglycan bridge formation glycyltransferase FemA/FemB family protein [Arcanobacterium wilhelmae]